MKSLFDRFSGKKNTNQRKVYTKEDRKKYNNTIPEGFTEIENDCFSWCDFLISIKIPTSVTSIGNGCFNECSSLTSITIPTSVKSIGDECFYNCNLLIRRRRSIFEAAIIFG